MALSMLFILPVHFGAFSILTSVSISSLVKMGLFPPKCRTISKKFLKISTFYAGKLVCGVLDENFWTASLYFSCFVLAIDDDLILMLFDFKLLLPEFFEGVILISTSLSFGEFLLALLLFL